MRTWSTWSTKPLAASLEPLQLYRALLRECTYLPDPNARVFVHNHVVKRFRRYCPRPSTKPDLGPPRRKWIDPLLIAKRRPTLLRTAADALRTLYRANCGHRNMLDKILAMTYGRTGPRKRELIGELMPKKGTITRAGRRKDNIPEPSPKLLAILSSQASNNSVHFPRKVLRHWQLKIPEKNKWGRPLPLCRVRNIKRRWFVDVLDKVLVPLPAEEWFVLQQRVNGEIPYEGPVARRTGSTSQALQSGLQAYRRERRISRPHNLTRRFMRRLWERTFAQCPLVTHDPQKPMGWNVEWGKAKKEMPFGLQKAATAKDSSLEGNVMGFFEGVNDFGEIEGGKKQSNRISQLGNLNQRKESQV